MEHHRKQLIIGISLLSIVAIVLILLVTVYRPSNQPLSNTSTSSFNPSVIPTPPTINPQISFDGYKLETSMPVLSQNLKIYTFKTQFTEAEIKTFGSKFGFDTLTRSEENKRFYTLSNAKSTNNLGYALFDSETGAFTLQSFGDIRLGTTTENSYRANVQQYVQTNLFTDQTILCDNSFERTGLDRLVFVICHRNTQKNNEPLIVNFPGILNVPESKPLASLQVGMSDETAPPDDTIKNVSNGQQGVVQPTDFNTVIVGIEKQTNRLTMVSSSIRWIERTETVDTARITTPQDAFTQLQAKQSELLVSVPAGSGSPDIQKVYTPGKMSARSARITDYVVVYLEKPGYFAQTTMTPYYLFRGLAALESGYTVRFAEIIPATDLLVSQRLSDIGKPSVAGEETEETTKSLPDDYSLKQGTFRFDIKNIQLPKKEQEPSECRIPFGAQEIKFNVPGIGEMTVANYASIDRPHILFFKSAPIPFTGKDQILQALFGKDGPVAQQYLTNVARQLQSNPQLLSAQTVKTESDVYSLFSKISSKVPLLTGDSNPCNTNLSVAPPNPQCVEKLARAPNNYYQATYLADISETVAKQMITALSTNQIQAFANRGDSLPTAVNENLFWVFINDDVTGGVGSVYKKEGFCYLSGVSPAIFVYPHEVKRSIVLKPEFPLTYTYPLIGKNGWIVDNTNPYYYYEYSPEKINFSIPENGWSIRTEEISSFIKTLGKQLNLNSEEIKRLQQDTNITLSQRTEYLTIFIANEQEINKKLPLSIQEQPNVIRRIHLLIKPETTFNPINAPVIDPIQRQGVTVVEVGAREIK